QVSFGSCLAVQNSKNVPFRGGNQGSATVVSMHFGEAGSPVSRQTSTRLRSIGRPSSLAGCFASDAFIISVQTGSALWLEKAPRKIGCGLSNPAQTLHVISLSYPTNQTSVKLYAVPVLPAAGNCFRPNWRAFAAVPLCMTSVRNECTSNAIPGSTTFTRFGSER